ncbi:hypothetical protein BDY21DRAFT_356678, partial [Lineolata rhizophorae]
MLQPALSMEANIAFNKHVNRKHMRRYKCPNSGCSRAFALQADLVRHNRTVYRSRGNHGHARPKTTLA